LRPCSQPLKKDLGLAHVRAASLFLFVSMGYSVSLLMSGFVSHRLQHRKTIILSAVAVGLSLIGISFCHTIWTIRAGLLLLGLASGLYLPFRTCLSHRNGQCQALGKSHRHPRTGPNLSFFMAPACWRKGLMMWFSWRGVLVFLGGCSILTGVFFSLFGKGGDFRGEAPNFLSLKTLFSERSFWIMMVLFLWASAPHLGIYTMLPLFWWPSTAWNETGPIPWWRFHGYPACSWRFWPVGRPTGWVPAPTMSGVFFGGDRQRFFWAH
jgi:NNP family nitrate/nitrite transporter-like MFS transporter